MFQGCIYTNLYVSNKNPKNFVFKNEAQMFINLSLPKFREKPYVNDDLFSCL